MRPAKSQALSLAAHVFFVALLAYFGTHSVAPPLATVPHPPRVVPLIAPFRSPRHEPDQRSGGSNRTELPARRGLPPPRSYRTFVLPPVSAEPKLAIPQTIAFAAPEPELIASQIGDPNSRYALGSLGIGGGTSIGNSGCCGGIGDTRDGRPGFSAHRRRATTPPRVLYQVEPEFSEEARKAKYQGVVVLSIEVDTNGRAREIRVIRSLGLGLDEKAVGAVQQWRFQPGSLDGKPVVSSAVIEVNFHLL